MVRRDPKMIAGSQARRTSSLDRRNSGGCRGGCSRKKLREAWWHPRGLREDVGHLWRARGRTSRTQSGKLLLMPRETRLHRRGSGRGLLCDSAAGGVRVVVTVWTLSVGTALHVVVFGVGRRGGTCYVITFPSGTITCNWKFEKQKQKRATQRNGGRATVMSWKT